MANRHSIIRLKHEKDALRNNRHPWIFSGALAGKGDRPKAGEIVTVCTSGNEPFAAGFFNPGTDIAIRVLSWNPDAAIDRGFFKSRIHAAIRNRSAMRGDANAYRLVNAEGDRLPGLIVDQYGPILVVSIETAGMESCREWIFDILAEELNPEAIYEKSSGRSRSREGLEYRTGWVGGKTGPEKLKIMENGLQFEVDIPRGQKTGFFLDQRDNRKLISSLCAGKSVLNCFSYSGAFSVYAAKGGASKVVSVDSSSEANATASVNLGLNGFSGDSFPVLEADLFDFLRNPGEKYDLVILDPPAFAKSVKDVERAAKGYQEINRLAMRHLKEGGLLATFSCSNPVTPDLFEKMLRRSARDAKKEAQILKTLGPGMDHPLSVFHPEGRYLKGLLLRIQEE